MMRTYKFNDVHDMIDLAKTVQTSVYWSMKFHCEEEDPDEDISYRAFWDLVEYKVDVGCTAVSISDNNEVEFLR